MRPFLRAIMLLVMVGFVSPTASGQTVLEGTRPAQWRVVWLRDPATRALLAWNTRDLGTAHAVRWRERDQAASAFQTMAATSGKFSYASKTSDPHTTGKLHYHAAELTGLSPATEYEVQFVSDDDVSPLLYFRTAPAGDQSCSLLFGGDSRSDQAMRQEMNRLMARLVADGAASTDPADDIIALMHGGDYVATGTSLDEWSEWMSDHELTVGDDGRLLPIIPARGNHDRGRLFCEAFGFPKLDQHNWYALSIGNRLRIVTLNTEASIAGDQAAWLSRELVRSRPTHRWLIVQYHRPAFPAVKWPSGARVHWVPRFEEYDVDLVCEADGHTIKRTVPIRGSQSATRGVVYIGEGGLGVPQRTPKTERWYLQPPGMAGRGHHVQRLRFEPDRMTYECVLLGGEIYDRWTMDAREFPAR